MNNEQRQSRSFLETLKSMFFSVFSSARETKPAFAVKCYRFLQMLASGKDRKKQDASFPVVREAILAGKRAMIFLVPAWDGVNGGLMSISNIASRSQQMKELHGCEVVMVTLPGKITISGFTQFDCPWQIFRYEQLENLFPQLEEVFVQIPEAYIPDYLPYLRKKGGALSAVPVRRVNILDQNIEQMPPAEIVQELCGYFTSATQTCAHGKYCTPEMREKYGVPTHLLPAQIPTRYYQTPFEEKENLIAYSNDLHPQKEWVLEQLHTLLPEYRFLMIEGMTFDEYKQTISRAKWTLTFGEGWDGYFLEPYFSSSIGLTVFNEAFCPPVMKTLPSVFPDYDTLPERLAEFIHTHDEESVYNEVIALVRGTLYPPPPPDYVYQDPLGEFYRGNYTIP